MREIIPILPIESFLRQKNELLLGNSKKRLRPLDVRIQYLVLARMKEPTVCMLLGCENGLNVPAVENVKRKNPRIRKNSRARDQK